MARGMQEANSITKRVAEAEGVVFVDGAVAVSKDMVHFSDEVHFFSVGAENLAAAVVQGIVEAKIIPRRRGI